MFKKLSLFFTCQLHFCCPFSQQGGKKACGLNYCQFQSELPTAWETEDTLKYQFLQLVLILI